MIQLRKHTQQRSFMKYGLILGLVWFVRLALLAFRRGKSPTGEWNGNDCLPSLHSFGVAFGFCVRHWLYSVAYSHYRKRGPMDIGLGLEVPREHKSHIPFIISLRNKIYIFNLFLISKTFVIMVTLR